MGKTDLPGQGAEALVGAYAARVLQHMPELLNIPKREWGRGTRNNYNLAQGADAFVGASAARVSQRVPVRILRHHPHPPQCCKQVALQDAACSKRTSSTGSDQAFRW